jgi:hypothetical protein
MVSLRFILTLTALCFAIQAGARGPSKDPHRRIPRAAYAFGVRVGWDTMDDLARALGPGLAVTGGHPQGAKYWRTVDGYYIHADGFDGRKDRHGYVIDVVSVSRQHIFKEYPSIPLARRSARSLRLVGSIALGMSRRTVTRTLHAQQQTAKSIKGGVTYSQPGFVRVNDSTVCRQWSVCLWFTNERLAEITVSGDSSYEKTANSGDRPPFARIASSCSVPEKSPAYHYQPDALSTHSPSRRPRVGGVLPRKDRPKAQFFCYTSSPNQMVYFDTEAGLTKPLPDPAEYLRTRPGGYCAFYEGGRIGVYRFAKRVFSRRLRDARLIGWLGDRFYFSEEGRPYYLEIKSLRVNPASFPDNTLDIQQLGSGSLTVEQTETDSVVKQFDSTNNLIRKWQEPGSASRVLSVSGRFAVTELHRYDVKGTSNNEPQKVVLWIIDIKENRESFYQLPGYCLGYSHGQKPDEIILGLSVGRTKDDWPKTTRIVALNLTTLKQRPLVERPGQRNLVGITGDKEWVFLMRPYYEVGPSELSAFNLKTGAVCVVRGKVYEFALTTKK